MDLKNNPCPGSSPPSAPDLVARARESMDLGGPPAPWEVVGNTSIRTADGQEMIFESYWNGKPHAGINSWTRQRICDAINMLPQFVAEIERLSTGIEDICQQRATSPITRARLRHLKAGVDWRKAK